MFGKKKLLDFESNNYKLKDNYVTDNLVVANLKYISSEATPYGSMVKQTEQKYIFELLNENGKIRYREYLLGLLLMLRKVNILIYHML